MIRPTPLLRLAAVGAVLAGAFAAFWWLDLVDTDDLRSLVDPFGPFAPLAFVAVGGVLGAALVPGPILSAASGVLFGAGLGAAVSLASAVLSATIALLVGGHAAGPPFRALAGERLAALAALAERHGTTGVVVQRLVPGVPDPPLSYAFGMLGVRLWQIALGTAIGSAPRAFSYTAVGASLDDPESPLLYAGIAGLVVTALAGAELSRRLLAAGRRTRDREPARSEIADPCSSITRSWPTRSASTSPTRCSPGCCSRRSAARRARCAS